MKSCLLNILDVQTILIARVGSCITRLYECVKNLVDLYLHFPFYLCVTKYFWRIYYVLCYIMGVQGGYGTLPSTHILERR